MRDADLPSAYTFADNLSTQGQRQTRVLTASQLLLMIAAGIAGLWTWTLPDRNLDVLAGLGALGFLAAILLTLVSAAIKPHDRWYRGRAAAESIKTLSWRFAVGGDPFPVGDGSRSAHSRYLDRINAVLKKVRDLGADPVDASGGQLTKPIIDLRGKSFDERRDSYVAERLEDQIDWYTRRANRHKKAARQWIGVTVAANIFGLAGGLMRFVGAIEVGLLGVGAAIAAGATAWNELNQHRTLRSSYALTAQELGVIRDRAAGISESDWPLFVSDAEEAISREHAMWLARHGHPTTASD